jgi:hypothetical protein
MDPGNIAGIVIGSVVGAAIVASMALAMFVYHKRKQASNGAVPEVDGKFTSIGKPVV